MAGRRRASGGSDPGTLAAILNLGNAHIATGNHTAALPLVQEALDGLCRVRGRAAAAVTNEKTVGRRFARVRAQALAAATTVAKAPVAARRGRRRRCVARGDGRPRSVAARHVPARERSPPFEHTLASETRDGRATRAPAADIPPARLLLRRSHARGSDTLDARQQSESDALVPQAVGVANRFGLGDSCSPRPPSLQLDLVQKRPSQCGLASKNDCR